jgi:hypothetical protein
VGAITESAAHGIQGVDLVSKNFNVGIHGIDCRLNKRNFILKCLLPGRQYVGFINEKWDIKSTVFSNAVRKNFFTLDLRREGKNFSVIGIFPIITMSTIINFA